MQFVAEYLNEAKSMQADTSISKHSDYTLSFAGDRVKERSQVK